MKAVPVIALTVLACSAQPSGDSSSSSDSLAPVGSAAEALRELGARDADVVERCRAKVARCAADAGSGGTFCERLAEHCDAFEAQLAEARAEVEACLEQAAECEENATEPAQCEAARAACAPPDRDFRARRERTLSCSDRAEQCFAPRRFFGRGAEEPRADAGGGGAALDAGAPVCDAEASDFVGCCRGRHGERGDAGADGQVRDRQRFGGGFGFRPRHGGEDREGDGEDDLGADGDDDERDVDAGAPRRRF